jgi:glycosyltransferase involved in cell wall biosynthesis
VGAEARAPEREDVGKAPAGGRFATIACVSWAPWNPYLRLLYDSLAGAGIRLAEDGSTLTLGWLWDRRRTVGFVHLHWPEGQYRVDRGPAALRVALAWLKLGLFAARLATARALGYRLVWTIHQVYPHETRSRLQDRVAALLLSRASHVLLAHDRPTAAAAAAAFGVAPERIHVVVHGSYIGVYPPGRGRSEVRRELGVPEDAVAFLAFGELRGYKGIRVLLDAWERASLASAALVIAGNPKDASVADAVERAERTDSRIRLLLGFRPVEAVAELFGACDAAVLSRGDGGTSGSLILALSLGAPVVFPAADAYEELVAGEEVGWRFRPGDAESLAGALQEAAQAPAEARRRGERALEVAGRWRWPEIGAGIARLLAAAAPPR